MVRIFVALLVLGSCGDSGGSEAKDKLRGSGPYHWFRTCGDPVCRDEDPPASTCGTAAAGDSCATRNQTCEPGLGCGVLLQCTDSDPTREGCPVSQRAHKQNIRYVPEAERKELAQELLSIRLATYQYKTSPADPRLGFIIEDQPGRYAVLPSGERVDLYGYTSMAVATIQLQAQKIAELEARLERLEQGLRSRPAK